MVRVEEMSKRTADGGRVEWRWSGTTTLEKVFPLELPGREQLEILRRAENWRLPLARTAGDVTSEVLC